MIKHFHFLLLILGLCCACESPKTENTISNNTKVEENLTLSEADYQDFIHHSYDQAYQDYVLLKELVNTWNIRTEESCESSKQVQTYRLV